MTDGVLKGCTALIVEDDYYQAQDCRLCLVDEGAGVVILAGRLEGAMQVVSQTTFDLALLDINLGFDDTFELARDLRRGGTGVLFLSGYERWIVPQDLADVPLLGKPVSTVELVRELGLLYHRSKSGIPPFNPDETRA
jgi:DNA-binding response OmpR family regulator